MNDKKLKEVAKNCFRNIILDMGHGGLGDSDLKAHILKALVQVRDAHSCSRNQHATQFCLQAEGLAKKLELAVDVLERVQYLLGEKDFSLIGEALEKIKY